MGGGISNYGGDLVIQSSLIEGNTAVFSGGGIDNEARNGTPRRLEVRDSTITGNSASTGAGIATNAAGNVVSLDHVTFNFNGSDLAVSIASAGQTVDDLRLDLRQRVGDQLRRHQADGPRLQRRLGGHVRLPRRAAAGGRPGPLRRPGERRR